jgi:hypothetical protein
MRGLVGSTISKLNKARGSLSIAHGGRENGTYLNDIKPGT